MSNGPVTPGNQVMTLTPDDTRETMLVTMLHNDPGVRHGVTGSTSVTRMVMDTEA